MKPIHFPPLLLLGAGLLGAQSTSTRPPAEEPVNLEQFVVSASPFARAQDQVVQPTSVLSGQRLTLARQPTLGETLAREPGISSTYFGPGASRPVIRGLGGDRIRVLQGGIGTLDASVISPDHAVSLDPALIERVEIVRGPATLLYGGSAIGGVVNVIDGRLPEEPPTRPAALMTEVRAGSAADERAAAALANGRAGPLAWRVDGFTRRTGDLRIPGFAETDALRAEHGEHEDEPPARDHLPNSATDSSGAGTSLVWFGQRGHLGLALSGFDTLYGVPGHEHHEEEEEAGAGEAGEEEHEHGAVRIDLQQRRWDLHGELLQPAGGLRVARLQLGAADYEHRELEGDELGTRFTNRAFEGRLELLHEPIASFEGALGTQFSHSDFAAAGAEAFMPPSETRTTALFLYEESPRDRVIWQFGARLEGQQVKPAAGSGLPLRSHTSTSVSGGLVWKLPAGWSAALSASRNERAPNAQELFADGPHAGTGTYELGDPSLGTERATGLDFSLRRRAGSVTGVATVFVTDFDGYIFERPTGAEDDGLPVYAFTQSDARFTGAELELIAHLHGTGGHLLDLRLTADTVRATNRTTGQPLPRLTPQRIGAGLDYRTGPLSVSADVRHAASPRRLAPGETDTPAATTLDLSGAWRVRLGAADAEFFVRASNLTDETVRLHTSFLKDVAPLPGRDFTAGVRLNF